MERDLLHSWTLVAQFSIAESGPSDEELPDSHAQLIQKPSPKIQLHRTWISPPSPFVERNVFWSFLTDFFHLSRTLQSIPESSAKRESCHLRFTSLMTGQVLDDSDWISKSFSVSRRANQNEKSSHRSQRTMPKVQSLLGGFTFPMIYELWQASTCIFAKRKLKPLVYKFLPLTATTKKENNSKAISKSEPTATSISVSLDPSILDPRAEVELRFWQRAVAQRIQVHGATHVATVDAMLELGKEFWNANNFVHASNVLEHAVKNAITIANASSMNDDRLLLVACAMEKFGWCLSCKFKDSARKRLKSIDYAQGAFKIRYQILGLYHGDTIESLNVMAGIHGRLGEFQRAAQAYHKVLLLRRAVYGPCHPSVAVASHKLGQIHVRLLDAPRALQYFNFAKRIYVDEMKLPQTNPSLAILLSDLRAVLRTSSE